MTTSKIFTNALKTISTDSGEQTTLKSIIITHPSNVIDNEYFRQAVQWHIFDISAKTAQAEKALAKQKLDALTGRTGTAEHTKAQDKYNSLCTMCKLLAEAVTALDKELSEAYEDIAEIKTVFVSDNFAKIYARTAIGAKSYKRFVIEDEASKGKLEDVKFSYANEDRIISLLGDFNEGKTKEQRKAATAQIERFANELFATNGGDLYKKVSYHFSVAKVNDQLYARSKELLKHDGKGHIQNKAHGAFTMCTQTFYMCLAQLKVPEINGEKIMKVDETASCDSVNLTIKRKVKAQDESK